MDQRVIAAVEYHLSMKGYRQVDSDPDMFLTYHASAAEETTLTTTSMGYGYGRGWRGGGFGGGGTSTTHAYKYVKGTLVVDMWDAKAKQLLWRGSATQTLSDKPEKNEKKINKAMEKLFQ